MRSHDSIALAPEPPRYPLAIAAGWIAGCGIVAATTGPALRVEPFYLPAILAVAWYYGPRHGMTFALGAALVAAAAEVTTHAVPGVGIPAWNFLARSLLFAVPAWLLCMLHQQRRMLAGLDKADPATGFATRYGLLDTLTDELVRTERLGGETSIICIGLNGLRRLAAEGGQEQIESVLRGFAGSLSASARRTDVVARLAEDEFALLLRGTGPDAAMLMADKLSQSLTAWLLTRGNNLTCSVGVTSVPRGRQLDAAALLARAVARMYENRSAGSPPRPVGATARAPATIAASLRESA